MHRHRAGARRHIGEIRIVVEPEFRNQGLGSLIVRELNDVAYNIGLERVIFELVEDIEQEAIKVAERLGFVKAESLNSFVGDMDGQPHNLVIMDLPLDIWPDWWAF